MNKGTMTTRTGAAAMTAVTATESLFPVFIGSNRTGLNESIHHDDVITNRYQPYKYCNRNNNNNNDFLDPSENDSEGNDIVDDDDMSMIVEHSSSVSTIGFDSISNNSNESKNKLSAVRTRKNYNQYNCTDKKLLTNDVQNRSSWLSKNIINSTNDNDEKEDNSDEFLLLFPNDYQSADATQYIEQQNHRRRPRMQRFLSFRTINNNNTCSSFKNDSSIGVKTISSSKTPSSLLLSGSLHNRRDSVYSALLDHSKHPLRQHQQQPSVNSTPNNSNPVTKSTHDERDHSNNSVQQTKMIPETQQQQQQQQQRLVMLKNRKASAQRLVTGCLSGFKNSIHTEQNNNTNVYMSKTVHGCCSLTIHEKNKLKQLEKKQQRLLSTISIKETDHDDSDSSSSSSISSSSNDDDSWANDKYNNQIYSRLDSNKRIKKRIQHNNGTGTKPTVSLPVLNQRLQPKTVSSTTSTTTKKTTTIKSIAAAAVSSSTTKIDDDVYQSYKNIMMELDGNDDEEASVGW